MCGQMQLAVSCGPAILPRACKPAQPSVPGLRGLPFHQGVTFLPTSHPCVCCLGTLAQLVSKAAWDRSDDGLLALISGEGVQNVTTKGDFSFVNKSQPSRGGRSSFLPPREFLILNAIAFYHMLCFFCFFFVDMLELFSLLFFNTVNYTIDGILSQPASP